MSTLTDDYRSTRGNLGQGVYSLKDLRAFVALGGGERREGERVPSWLESALNPVPHERWRPDYSFSDLISLFVVRELRRKGYPPRAIRLAEAWLREKWNMDRPFVSDDIRSDGVNIFDGNEVIPGQIEAADLGGQQTMREMVKDRLVSVRYSEGWAAYWVPMKNVLVDPRVQFGEPVIAGTRLSTELVADAVLTFGQDGAAERFGVSTEAVSSATEFEGKRAAVVA